jgi:hypothetical protein
MNRSIAVNHAIEIVKLRIQSGTHNNSKPEEILAELNALAEGVAAIDTSGEGASRNPRQY